MGTATVSELPGVAGAQKAIETLKLVSKPVFRGSERFWLTSGVLLLLYTSTHFPAIGPQPSLSERIQQSSVIINTTKIPLPASKRIEQNYLKPKIIMETAKPLETSESYLTNLVNAVVNDNRLGILDKDKEFWKKRMQQIISIESSGDPKAFSGKAYGLTQLRLTTAEEVAKKYGIAKYDLNNPWDSVFLGLAKQLDLAKRYDTELAAWAHHLGSGNMDIALRAYLIEDLRLKVKNVDDDIFKSNEMLLAVINKYKITPSKLLNSPSVTGKLKQIGAFGDNTDIYYSKLMAVTLPQTKG